MGAGMMFVPINAVAYRFIPRTESSNASGLFSLVRNEGSSIGVALVTTLLARHVQTHQAALVGRINVMNPLATNMLHQASGLFGPVDPTGGRGGLSMIYSLILQQAAILSYLDIFRIFSVAIVVVIPLVLFMKRGAVTAEAVAAH
jgi:DHA2 family multidrug resistance protein